MPLAISPVDPGGAETQPPGLLSFIQFLSQSVELGLPSANSLDFTTGLTATRGSGASANVVTVRVTQPLGFAVVTTSTYTLLPEDSSVIVNYAGTCTLTLPDATLFPGRILRVRTVTANLVVSASSNVAVRASLTAGTAILAATDGHCSTLISDGTIWQEMAGN